ncbi:MAG: Ribonuclease HII [Elusimicrobia bacterium ADurb.Bin231]|nr:MAG: Ribonuclease HII [Elusimicrobia bacterium ADurb.Bin231]
MKTSDALYRFDENICPTGYIAGVDEAGRGPLAGPVVSAAVILRPGTRIRGLNDSKKLSPSIRKKIYDTIVSSALDVKFDIVENSVIDSINILRATLLSMKNAVEQLVVKPSIVLIDGNKSIKTNFKQKIVIKGDGLSAAIAAASVIAKVTRDIIMEKYDKEFPQYGFACHKGYGTAKHIESLSIYGPCRIHRMSFRPVMDYRSAADS